jgi:predicted nucleotidyltransferase
MTKKDIEIARKLKEKLVKSVQLIDYRIFGSRAYGKAHKYSDMDVFLEIEKCDKKIEEYIYDVAWEVGFENLIHISPLIFTRFEIENSPLRISPIVKTIKEQGIKI